MNWREVAVTVSSQGEEAVADLFYQLGCTGVTVDNPALIQEYIESEAWDYYEFAELQIDGKVIVKGYLFEDNELDQKLTFIETGIKELINCFPEWVVQIKGHRVKEEDWANAWKAYFKPTRIGKHFLIKPTWEEIIPLPDDEVLELDPGMAFGTGTHATTTLCLEALEEIVRPGQKVYDLGTGSGILAIAAAKLGAEVAGVDLDEVAVRVARANVTLNDVESQVTIYRGDLGTVLQGQAQIVVANIIADVILDLIPDLPRILQPGGDFLASGIILGRSKDVEKGLEEAGMEIIARKEEGSWVLFHARRAVSASV